MIFLILHSFFLVHTIFSNKIRIITFTEILSLSFLLIIYNLNLKLFSGVVWSLAILSLIIVIYIYTSKKYIRQKNFIINKLILYLFLAHILYVYDLFFIYYDHPDTLNFITDYINLNKYNRTSLIPMILDLVILEDTFNLFRIADNFVSLIVIVISSAVLKKYYKIKEIYIVIVVLVFPLFINIMNQLSNIIFIFLATCFFLIVDKLKNKLFALPYIYILIETVPTTFLSLLLIGFTANAFKKQLKLSLQKIFFIFISVIYLFYKYSFLDKNNNIIVKFVSRPENKSNLEIESIKEPQLNTEYPTSGIEFAEYIFIFIQPKEGILQTRNLIAITCITLLLIILIIQKKYKGSEIVRNIFYFYNITLIFYLTGIFNDPSYVDRLYYSLTTMSIIILAYISQDLKLWPASTHLKILILGGAIALNIYVLSNRISNLNFWMFSKSNIKIISDCVQIDENNTRIINIVSHSEVIRDCE